jgi:mono/diheme cytochrome c family protein
VEASSVSAGKSLARAGRRAAATAFFSLVLLSGCEPDPYPSDLRYPARTDLIVLSDVKRTRDQPTPGLGHFQDRIDALKKDQETNVLDPGDLPGGGVEELESALEDIFGTPAAPTVALGKVSVSSKLRKAYARFMKQMDNDTLAAGSVLYRRHCVHCHGLAGDGRGPTAPWVHPHPRDYRSGLFKFRSVTSDSSKPTRADLLRTLREGIEGTSMPNFRQLNDEERDQIVSYVIHLSARGETEMEMMKDLKQGVKDIKGATRRKAVFVVSKEWAGGADPIGVLPYPYGEDGGRPPEESIRNGHELFLTKGGCIECHTDYGRQSSFMIDAWGTVTRPANLTEGLYRGGRRPVDIYYRVVGGIVPSGMSGASEKISNPEDLWDLVNFVKALPYPNMLPKDVKDAVYGPSGR